MTVFIFVIRVTVRVMNPKDTCQFLNLSQVYDLTFRYILRVCALVLFAAPLVAELLFALFALPLRKIRVVKIGRMPKFLSKLTRLSRAISHVIPSRPQDNNYKLFNLFRLRLSGVQLQMDRMNNQNQTQYFQSSDYHAAAYTTQNYEMSNLSPLRTNPRNSCGVRLRPVSDLRQAPFTLLEMCTKDSL